MIVRRLVAVLMAAALAVPLSRGVIQLAGLQRSTWMVIDVDSNDGPPPSLRVAYSSGRDEMLPVIWEDLQDTTLLGIRSDAPALLLRIDTDRGAVAPWLAQTWAGQWLRSADPAALRVQGSGVLELAGSFRQITLTFAPSAASVDVGWGTRREHLDLRQTAVVTLASAPGRRGWVLLPPERIPAISLVPAPASEPFALRAVALRDPRLRVWTPSAAVAATLTGAAVCRTSRQAAALLVEPAAGICEVPLAGITSLNDVSWLVTAVVWLGTAASIVLGLALLRWISIRFASEDEHLERRPHQWSVGVAATAVTVVVLAYHVSYGFAVPAHFNFDSLGYWAFGHNFLHTRSLDAIGTCRTPGYPSAIALSIAAFGEQLRPLVLAQQLALCVLTPLTIWALYPRTGVGWAALAGLLAGISPIMSLTGNVVWTETLFSVIGTATLLLFLRDRTPRVAVLVLAGALAGVATLVRPNGAVIFTLMSAAVFVRWWTDRSGAVSLASTAKRIVALGIPFVLVTAIWIGHFHRVTGHWGLSDANCSLDGQSRALAAANLKPTNIFQLAGFLNLMAQSDRVSALTVGEPYRTFFEFFPARHRYRAERFLPWELIYDDRLPGEIFREYLREDTGLYLRQVGDALAFNLTHRERPRASVFAYADLDDVLRAQRSRLASAAAEPKPRTPAPAPPPALTWTDADAVLSRLAADAGSRAPRLGRLYLRLSDAAMWSWWLAVACAAAGCLACLRRPELRSFALLGLHAFVLAAAPAVLGMGADRYAMAGEPAIYVLAVLLGASVVRGRRLQRSLMTVA